MNIDPHSGLLDVARQLPSPNCDARPAGAQIDLLIIHNISLPPGCFDGDAIDRFFTNTLDIDADPFYEEICEMRVSAHLLLRRDGSIVQYVPGMPGHPALKGEITAMTTPLVLNWKVQMSGFMKTFSIGFYSS